MCRLRANKFPTTTENVQWYSEHCGWPLSLPNARDLTSCKRYQRLLDECHLWPHHVQSWKHWLVQLIIEHHRLEPPPPPPPRPKINPNRVTYWSFTPTVIYEVGYSGPLIAAEGPNSSMRAFEERRASLDWDEVFI